MLYGNLAGDILILVSGPDSGYPIIESQEPVVPDGYVATSKMVFDERMKSIIQTWDIKPVEGTEQEAALALTKLQYLSITDDNASYRFRALADEWTTGMQYYGPSDSSGAPQSRVRFKGDLYKCKETYTSDGSSDPNSDSTHWVKVTPTKE